MQAERRAKEAVGVSVLTLLSCASSSQSEWEYTPRLAAHLAKAMHSPCPPSPPFCKRWGGGGGGYGNVCRKPRGYSCFMSAKSLRVRCHVCVFCHRFV